MIRTMTETNQLYRFKDSGEIAVVTKICKGCVEIEWTNGVGALTWDQFHSLMEKIS